MRRKELKNLAKKIIKAEQIIQNSEDKQAIYEAQQEIIHLSANLELDDLIALDQIIQDILEKQD